MHKRKHKECGKRDRHVAFWGTCGFGIGWGSSPSCGLGVFPDWRDVRVASRMADPPEGIGVAGAEAAEPKLKWGEFPRFPVSARCVWRPVTGVSDVLVSADGPWPCGHTLKRARTLQEKHWPFLSRVEFGTRQRKHSCWDTSSRKWHAIHCASLGGRLIRTNSRSAAISFKRSSISLLVRFIIYQRQILPDVTFIRLTVINCEAVRVYTVFGRGARIIIKGLSQVLVSCVSTQITTTPSFGRGPLIIDKRSSGKTAKFFRNRKEQAFAGDIALRTGKKADELISARFFKPPVDSWHLKCVCPFTVVEES